MENIKEHVVAKAVAPLKEIAVNHAEEKARELIHSVRTKLEANGWDLDKAAPRPEYHDYGKEYFTKKSNRTIMERLTNWVDAAHLPGTPLIVKMTAELEYEFIESVKRDAAAQYEMFVAKLVHKIGEATEATLDGSSVWSHSYLDIVKPNGVKEIWKTRLITNVSKHGKFFNQWPTRKVKRKST